MRPLILKLTAFGPYKNTEVIDFNELKGNNLYVISGNTGAGKTTIFDGICFALYGSASGTDREDMRMLRSHFANDDTHTAVELTFLLNQRTYRVLRQMGHIKSGNKTRTGDSYEFYEITESGEIPCVERQIVSEIDRKIESLIGLNQDQFKQIVMLPQGEFRKLLTSSTENKEEILRRLFKTDQYKQLNEILKSRLDDAHKQLLKFNQQKDHYIQQIRGAIPERTDSKLFTTLNAEHHNVNQIVDGLQDEVNYYSEQIKLDKHKHDIAQAEFDKKQTAYIHAQHVNKRFDELDLKEMHLKEHLSKSDDIKKLKVLVQRAEKASRIEPYEQQYNEVKEELKHKNEQYENTKKSLSNITTELDQAEKTYQTELANSDTRQKTYVSLERLNEQLPIVEQLEEEKTRVLGLKQSYEQLTHDLKLQNLTLEKQQESLKQLTEQIHTETNATDQYSKKFVELERMRSKVKILRDYIQITQNEQSLKAKFESVKTQFDEAKRQYKTLEETWLNNQASELASHLHNGSSCPVCGSVEHPNKATSTSDAVTRTQLDQSRQELNNSEHIYLEARAAFETNLKQIEEKLVALQENNLTKEDAQTYDAFVEKGKQLKAEVESLEKRKHYLDEVRQKEKQENIALEQLDSNIRKITETVANAELQFKEAEYIYLNKLQKIPEELQVPDTFKRKINETKVYYDKLELAWKEAQERYHQKKNQHTKAQADLDNLTQSLTQLETKYNHTKTTLQTKLSEAEFADFTNYSESKISSLKREQLKEEIDSFDQQLQTLSEQIKSLTEELNSQEKHDLTTMKTAVDELKLVAEQALNTLNLSKRYAEEITKLIEQILEVSKNVLESEKKRASIEDLYDTIRGQNKHKLSFERYLQIEYLEQIIDACNHRLRTLSNGQFQLIHSERQEARGKQSGLALDVQDSLTGETRDVKTMSGGEKFNASLCLALGMSDVIQSFQGNISIDTLFIDEGFGSLDDESLENATKILIDLQETGRTIGVISHVQELKRILPATLQVHKTKDGYSTTKFLINN